MTDGLRSATGADYGLYVAFHAELATGDEPLERSRWEAECAPSAAFLAEGTSAVGYVHWELAGEHAHVRHVVVDPEQRGRGLGRALMRELAARLRAQGASAWRLNVLASNAVALRLYAGFGFNVRYSTTVLRLPWEHAERLPRASVRAGDADPRRDAEYERSFALLEGQLARARAKSGVSVLSAAAESGAAAGIAVFDPSFPGAYPFRCRPAEHARGLIEAMRERYEGDKPWVQLVIEDAPEVAALLEAAGAERVHEILHLRGEIPR